MRIVWYVKAELDLERAVEFIRADNPVDTLGEFTISQFLALVMTAIGLIGLLVLQRMPPRSPRAQLWTPEDEAQASPPSGGKPAKTARAVAAQT